MALSLYCFIAFCMSFAAVSFAGSLCTTAELAEENFRKLAIANNDLALHVHRQLASKSTENIFFSPLSLSTTFGMLYYGTRGKTAKELRKALGYETAGLPQGLIHQTFKQYLSESLPSQDSSAYVLNSANAILLDKHLDLVLSYKTDVQDLYNASVRDVDFTTQTSQITSEINDWVKEKTNGKIEKLLDDLDPSTAFVLLNAVYFKGTWKTQFDSSETGPGVFFNHGIESQSQKVSMMRMTENFHYIEDEDVEVLEMPYKGENVSMIILLPREFNGLETLEKSLTLEKLFAIRHQLRKREVHLTIPKFKVEYSTEMSDAFQSIGVKSIFTPGADLSGITSSPNVFVSQVLHKAVVEVNEEGSEAAGTTAVISNRMGGIVEPHFTVNRPFLFAIVDKRSDMLLFLGRITTL